MAKQMLTLKLQPQKASLAQVRRKLKLSPIEVDSDFGVVKIDPKKNLYAILVDEAAVQRVGGKAGVAGPFSNPPIEPFGPPISK